MPKKNMGNFPKRKRMGEKVLLLILEDHERLLTEIEHDSGDANEKGAWLMKKAKKLNYGYRLETVQGRKMIRELFDKLTNGMSIYKIDDKCRDLEILVANLIATGRMREFQGKSYRIIRMPVKISKSPNSYIRKSNNPDRCINNEITVASPFIILLVDILESANLLVQIKGYHTESDSKLTRIWPTKDLLLMFKPFTEVDFGPVELVNLRDENKRYIHYKDTDETNRIRAILRNANIVNRLADIMLKTRSDFKRVETDLHAIFNNGSFEKGGRLYNNKNGYQYLPEKIRKNIYINNEPTIELDFSGIHPRLLYAEEGIQYDGDLYNVICPDHTELRKIFKITMLLMINNETYTKAFQACNDEFNHKGYKTYRPLLKKFELEIPQLIEMVKNAHIPISDHFCSIACYQLMNKDSKIALNIIDHFISLGIPILAIHDSFIVAAQYEEELLEVMKKVYRTYSGGFDCPVTRK
jgi:G:T-mismatch repair DNA endonuclease (very short patch repair protein)